MVSLAKQLQPALWPPDDTEESILGINRHQFDIVSLRLGINELAEATAAGGPLPWEAISQMMLLGCMRSDGSPYTVYPDIAVFAHPMERTSGSYSVAQDGAPVLVVEVASPSTVEADLDLDRGKGWTYARAGVAEYMVLDPSGELIPELGRGWQFEQGAYQAWLPDESGRWRSALLPLSLGVADELAAVWDQAGKRQVREREIQATIAARVLEEKRSVARRQARARFGVVASLEARIDQANDSELDLLLDRLVTSSRIEDL